MKNRNFSLKYLPLLIIYILATSSCGDIRENVTDAGVLKGKISIGPLCPVERIPPDPACLPTAETYKAWATAIFSAKGKAKIATLDPNLDGSFEIELPVGDYIVDYNVVRNIGVGKSNLPAAFSITAKDTTTININIDTGIR
ncbi:MAG: hypothetical protein WCP85_14065 [Mariniphaga sp.]